jgi:transposase-like protein
MPKPAKVSTPGSYTLASEKKEKKKKKKSDAKKGRPSLPTKKKRGTSRKNNYRSRYTPEDMEKAVSLVRNEDYSVAQAALTCGVPRVTLLDRLNGNHKTGRVGRPCVLSKVEEQVLVEVLVLMGQYNYPLTKRHLADMVKHFLDRHRQTRLKDNRPGRHWIRGFLKRNKDKVVIRKAQNIRRSRAAVSPAAIREYFSNLEKELEGVPPTHIFNCDESCMRDDPSANLCFFMKGVRYPEQVKDHSKTSFSVMFCCSAAGELLPPMTVYKSQSGYYYDTWAAGAPPGSVFTANKSGWFNMYEYEAWFEKVFLVWLHQHIPKEDIKVLIADNLGAHISQHVIELCKENNIRYHTIPIAPMIST